MGSIIKSLIATGASCIMCLSCRQDLTKTTNVTYLLNNKIAIEELLERFKHAGWDKVCRSNKNFITVVINSEVWEGYGCKAIFGGGDEQSVSRSATLEGIVTQLDKLGVSCIEGQGGTYIDFSDGMTLAVDQGNSRSDLIRIYRAKEIAPGWYYYLNTDD